MMQLQTKNSARPVCPHCSQAIDELWQRQLSGSLGKRYVYFCSNCQKILGVSHRKGFFMG